MSFLPVIPFGGYSGWRFLSRTLPDQTEQFSRNQTNVRDARYFRERIGAITSAQDLVNDYRLLRVALGAFGLQDDLPNKAFVQKLLAEGSTSSDALANRLADKRYKTFSDAFGFGSNLPPRTLSPGFADRILARFNRQEFERAVGEQNEDMRLALTAQRELSDLASREMSDEAAWFTIMGTPPLRKVFEVALGFPDSIGSLDLDLQLEAFRQASDRLLGTSQVQAFREPDRLEDLVRAFTIRAEVTSGPSPLIPGVAALTLLQSMTEGRNSSNGVG